MSATQDAAVVVRRHLELALSVLAAAVLALLSLNKLTSVISEIAVHGFCPVKELDEEGAKGDEELKSSEKETGLGQGEGAKDVSDQIDNEDMLDGAYQNPEDGQDKEEKDNKEEDTGIEMSSNFDSNLQDKKEEEEEEDEEDKEGELEDETGDVEGNEDLDKDKWGEEEDDKAGKAGLEDSEEHRARPRRRIWRSWLLRRIRRRAARRRRRGSIKRRRRRKTTRLRRLTTTRWIPTRAKTSSCPSQRL